MARTARGGLPLLMRAGWPLFVTGVPFVKRLVAMADNGLPVRAAKLRLYDEFAERLAGGPFVGGRDAPSLPDLSAYPQFALYHLTRFRGSDDLLQHPELMAWLGRMRPYVSGDPPLLPAHVTKRELP